MKAVVHAGAQAQGEVSAALVLRGQFSYPFSLTLVAATAADRAAIDATLRELLTRRGRGETLSAGQLVKDLAMLGGGGGGGGGGDGDGDGDAGYGGGGGGGGGGFANSASADEVAEALRILTAEDRPIIRFAGQNRVTVI
jgi:hypothetical protein